MDLHSKTLSSLVPMSNTLGERKELKKNLIQYTKILESKQRQIAIENTSEDTQYNIVFTFTDSMVEALGDTVSEGDKYALKLYPGEMKQFIRGVIKGFKWSLSFGAPDAAWQEKRASQSASDMQQEMQSVKAALKARPKAEGKYTAEYISEVCISAAVPFIDLTFAPKEQSLCRDYETPKPPPCLWMRPRVYCKEAPCLYVNTIEPNDIDQGGLGDCYFMCALACLSEFPQLVREMFCSTQYPELGCYAVRVCKNGWWQVCVIDDLLPVNPASKVPIYAKNREEPHELWVSLAEKAYAKLHGSYAAIRSGDPALAMADLVGGPYMRFKSIPGWDAKGEEIFAQLKEWDDKDYLLTLSTPGVDLNPLSGLSTAVSQENKSLAERYEAVGLCTGHAFSLISVVEYKGHKLCKIRNPWGNEKEWTGDWGDASPLWTAEMKRAVNFEAADDGTFWMAWHDVAKWFNNGSVTFVLPSWYQLRVAGNFDRGCPDVVLQLHVSSPTKLWLGLHQRDSRGVTSGDRDATYAGLMIAVLTPNANGKSVKVGTSGNFITMRDVFLEIELEPSPRPYYILNQAYQETDKSFVQSLFAEDPSGLKVTFVSTPDSVAKKKYNPVTHFEPSSFSQRVAAQHQLLLPSFRQRLPLTQTSETVNWQSEQSVGAPQTQPKRNIVSAASEPSTSRATGNSGSSAADPVRIVNLSIGVLSGRNLVSKDSNGLSDPFVTIKVLDAQGTKYTNIAKKSTKYINETLNPVWGETFVFQVKTTDQIFFACWDKDVFGKDAMGCVTIPLPTLGLKPGGEGKMAWFPLSGGDATGELQLLFTIVV